MQFATCPYCRRPRTVVIYGKTDDRAKVRTHYLHSRAQRELDPARTERCPGSRSVATTPLLTR